MSGPLSMNPRLNLKVLVLDSDFYAQQAMSAYLGWDRRTRVVALAYDLAGALDYLDRVAEAEWPDIVLLEPEAFPTAEALHEAITRLRQAIPDVLVMCIARRTDYVVTAAEAGARAYLLRYELKFRLVSVVCYALDHEFTVTAKVPVEGIPATKKVVVVFESHDYAGMTERIRQALWLCVICGMPAQLAADEMGVSPHTVRSYIKSGYRILEANDETDYPEEMGPLERAFMRFTALNTGDLQHEEDNDE